MKKNREPIFLKGKGMKKMYRIMKLSVILLMFCLIHVSASVYSQNEKITIKENKISLSDLLWKIQSKTDFVFAFSADKVEPYTSLTIDAEGNVDEVLEIILKDTNLDFEVKNGVYVLKYRATDELAFQQEKISITGIVTDSKGEPLPGANLLLKDKSAGTITNANGEFRMAVNGPNTELLITFIGFESKTIVVGQEREFNIVLEESLSKLGEIVVNGYQEVKKERVTGSVSTMNAKQIIETGAATIDQAIKGQLAGVSVISTTGRPGSSTQIRIRGLNSITGDMNPVWIVDGVEMQGAVPTISVGGVEFQNSLFTDGIGNIPPEDIKSITVLKDAAASAIYGARAANGVIVIETKSGVPGQKTMSISTQFGVDMAPKNNLQMMSSAQKLEFEKRLYQDNPQFDILGRGYQVYRDMNMGIQTKEEGESELEELRSTNTDWFDVIFRPATYQQYSITFRGGDEKMTYYVSGSLRDQKGILEGNDNTNFSGNFKLNYTPFEKLRIETGFRTSLRKDNYPTTATGMDPFSYATFANPYEKPYNEDGSYAYDRSYESTMFTSARTWEYDYNILEDLNDGNTCNEAHANTANIRVLFDITKTISIETLYSYSYSSTQGEDWASPGTFRSLRNGWLANSRLSTYSKKFNNGFLSESAGRNNEWQSRNLIKFNKAFNEHFINAFVGQEMSHRKINNFYSFLPEYYPEYRLGGYPDIDVPLNMFDTNMLGGSAFMEDKRLSYFANASYSYKDIYVLSGSVRYDGVNTIANTNQFTPLWNMSGKWNLQNESFMKNVSWVNVLSVRAGFGYTGSIDRTALPFSTLSYEFLRQYGDYTVATDVNWKNPDIKWQKKLDRNIGVDFSILGSKLNGDFNYYNNEVTDLLGTEILAISSGIPSVRANVGSLKNYGYELSLNGRLYRKKDFTLSANFNINYNVNEITNTKNKKITDIGIMNKTTSQPYVQGYEVGALFGYEFAGVDPLTGNTLVYINDDSYVKPWEVHSEQNGRQVIDFDENFNHEAAITSLGQGYPPIAGGFGFTAMYKGFQLNSHFTFMAGHYIRSINNSKYSLSGYNKNTIVNDLNHWREPNDQTPLPELRDGYSKNSYARYFFDSDIEKGDYLKLSSLSLNYFLPRKMVDKLGLQRVKAGITTLNLFTWTKYKGIDPENLGAIGYPNPTRFMFNLNIEI